MRIFVITGTYPNKENIQAGIFIKDQCEALASQGNQVVVLAVIGARWKKWIKKIFKRYKREESNSVIVYKMFYRSIAQSRLPRICISSYKKRINKLFRIALAEYGRPDILYAHFSFPAGYSATEISQIANVPLIVLEHHSLYFKTKLNHTIKNILKKSVTLADEFICVSNALKNAVISWTKTEKKILILPNMVDKMFNYIDKINKNAFICFSAGNLIKSKSYDVLIKAFCNAFKTEEKVELIIAGDGREKRRLVSLIKENKREKQITLLGRITRKEMLANYGKADCFIMASNHETFGIVYREAMIVGRPIISVKNGGIEDGWENESGILTAKDNLLELSEAMRSMYENIDKYDNKLISVRAKEKYSKEIVINKLMKIIENTVNSKKIFEIMACAESEIVLRRKEP